MKYANPGEQVTLRRHIEKFEKSVRTTFLKREAATAAAELAAAAADRAETALAKSDPEKSDYNDLAAAFHSADEKFIARAAEEELAWSANARAVANLARARAVAQASYAI